MTTPNSALLVLEDGVVFRGRPFGAVGDAAGELVFNTALTGYQEAITDPSYRGQILAMTMSQIGNYGISDADMESGGPTIAAFVCREHTRLVSNYRSDRSLHDWLASSGVPAIERIDTRALVRHLRERGSLRAACSTRPDAEIDDLRALARAQPLMSGCDLAGEMSTADVEPWSDSLDLSFYRGFDGLTDVPGPASGGPWRVAALDCGGKQTIYRQLAARGCVVTRLAHDADLEAILATEPHGLFISNGPGDPAAVAATIETLRGLPADLPVFGICLGHQLLALARGATTYKLKFGHRGTNQPVRNLITGHIEITSQNHGFAVDEASLVASGAEVTHLHLNDGTVAGFRDPRRPLFCVQYHPEAAPGPHESTYLFDCFVRIMRSREPLRDEDVQAARAATVVRPVGAVAEKND